MSTNHEPQIKKQQSGKSNEEFLSRIRNLTKEVLRPRETISSEKENSELFVALNVLNQVESTSRFAVGRTFQNTSSFGLVRIDLENHLFQLKTSAGEKIVFDSVNPRVATERIERLGPVMEVEEKRKIHKAEKALRHLLALNEC